MITGKSSTLMVMLSKFDLHYVLQNPLRIETFDFPDEEVLQVEEDVWTMYFDGASNQ